MKSIAVSRISCDFNLQRGRDSNPRDALTSTRFPGVRLKPLGHLSVLGKTNIHF